MFKWHFSYDYNCRGNIPLDILVIIFEFRRECHQNQYRHYRVE